MSALAIKSKEGRENELRNYSKIHNLALSVNKAILESHCINVGKLKRTKTWNINKGDALYAGERKIS